MLQVPLLQLVVFYLPNNTPQKTFLCHSARSEDTVNTSVHHAVLFGCLKAVEKLGWWCSVVGGHPICLTFQNQWECESHTHLLQQLARCTEVWKQSSKCGQIMFSTFLIFSFPLLPVFTAELHQSDLHFRKQAVVEGDWHPDQDPAGTGYAQILPTSPPHSFD